MRLKAISLKQPWASMIGLKTIETRRWYTSYRGDLLIVSSQKPADLGPTGVALCIVNLVDCRPMTRDDERAACCDWYEGAFAWVFDNICPIKNPFPVRGQLGIYEAHAPGWPADARTLENTSRKHRRGKMIPNWPWRCLTTQNPWAEIDCSKEDEDNGKSFEVRDEAGISGCDRTRS